MPEEEKDFITLDEAAKLFSVTRATLYNYMGDLNIKTHRFGRDKRAYLSREQVNLIREYRENPWKVKPESGEQAA